MQDAAKSIDAVIARLAEIIDESKTRGSRLGYFPALYRKVTISIKERIEAHDTFDDDARMEKLDVIFANRYIQAYDQLQASEQPTESWSYAFQASQDRRPIVLQHLLLGMNAHINLDLGIAAAEAVGPGDLPSLHADFNRINAVLGSLVAEVTSELAWIWPPLRWLGRSLGSLDDAIIGFSMQTARDVAWSFAQTLSRLDAGGRRDAIARRDSKTLLLARGIRNPGVLASSTARAVRLCERGTVSQIIDVLE